MFAPLSAIWAPEGLALRGKHRGTELARAVPTRAADGSLRIETPATPEIREAFKTRRYFSVEFHSLREVKTAGGVREIQLAFLDAAALVENPEYPNVQAEVRSSRRRIWL